MATIFRVAFLAALFFPLAGQAQSKCPLPQGMQASIQITKEAAQARLDGKSKEQLESAIPSVSARLPWAGVIMQSILDEVYSTPEALDPNIHAAYRMEVCFLLDQNPESESSLKFDLAYPILKGCKSEDGGEQTRCSMRVAHEITGIPE